MADNQGSFVLKSPPKASPETFKLPTSELDSMSMDKPRLPRTIFRCASRIVPDARQKKLCIGRYDCSRNCVRSFFRGDKQPGEVSFAERERKVEALGLQLACIKMNVTADELMVREHNLGARVRHTFALQITHAQNMKFLTLGKRSKRSWTEHPLD